MAGRGSVDQILAILHDVSARLGRLETETTAKLTRIEVETATTAEVVRGHTAQLRDAADSRRRLHDKVENVDRTVASLTTEVSQHIRPSVDKLEHDMSTVTTNQALATADIASLKRQVEPVVQEHGERVAGRKLLRWLYVVGGAIATAIAGAVTWVKGMWPAWFHFGSGGPPAGSP